MAQKGSLCSVSLGVEGMTCGSCVQSIEQRIGSLPGVVDIKVRNDFKDIRLCFSFIVKIFLFFHKGLKNSIIFIAFSLKKKNGLELSSQMLSWFRLSWPFSICNLCCKRRRLDGNC